MEAKLVVVGGDAKATEIKLKLPTIIGRGRGATLTLPHPLVSRQHCEIYEVEGQLHVRDLGSLNGTFVGNEPITEAALPPGELLTVGAVTFRAIYGELLEREKREKDSASQLSQRRAATKTARDQSIETLAEPNTRTVQGESPPDEPPMASYPSIRKGRDKAAKEPTVWAPQNVRAAHDGRDEGAAPEEAALMEASEVVLLDEAPAPPGLELPHDIDIDLDLDDEWDAQQGAAPNGSTTDHEKGAKAEALNAAAASPPDVDEVERDVVDEPDVAESDEAPSGPARPSAPAAISRPATPPPSSNGSPESHVDDELQKFLRNLK